MVTVVTRSVSMVRHTYFVLSSNKLRSILNSIESAQRQKVLDLAVWHVQF
jgi:hypothetical protein